MLWPKPARAVIEPTARELSSKLRASLCLSGRAPSPRAAWAMGVFDAQLEGLRLAPHPGEQLGSSDLHEAARLLAKDYLHHGVGSGHCPNGSGWVLSAPAPRSLERRDPDTYAIIDKDLGQYCQYLRLDYVAASGGAPRLIRRIEQLSSGQELLVNTSLLKDGTLSVSCLPQAPRWQGPVLWYLAPVRGGPLAEPPLAIFLHGPTTEPAKRLLRWVNAVRQVQGLKPLLSRHAGLRRSARQLSDSRTVVHNHATLESLQQSLRKSGGLIVGEDRVKAASVSTMAWLLWNSPRHRGLLLSPEASHLAISTVPVGKEHFAVLLFGKIKG